MDDFNDFDNAVGVVAYLDGRLAHYWKRVGDRV